ncbi:MAG: hypothetical protein PHW60_16365 [Kiritimatiellae bacterium]|nr:hypothetical protein [Kiritimatiellia bacterium]
MKSTVHHLPSVVHWPSSDLQSPSYSLQPSSRSGIALVMVLGILSVMLIFAVAFAVAMRTERMAAGNYADSVRARQLVHVGLARALDDLAVKLGANGLGSAGGGLVYPPWTVTNSYTNAYANTSPNLYLVFATNTSPKANEATNFVPRALWAAATNADCLGAANHWLSVDSIISNNGVMTESNRLGRVKYLILNCSGLLDANFVGRWPAERGLGTNPMEIAINNMPEFSSANNFIVMRNTTHYRYETLPELAALNGGCFSQYPSNFMVYSYALPGYWDAGRLTNRAPVNLAGDVSALALRGTHIMAAFTNAGFTDIQAGVLFTNLLDYVGGDSIPGGVSNSSPDYTRSVEAVPMINEIAFRGEIVGPIVQNTVEFEFWYPFVNFNFACHEHKFYVDYTVEGSGYSTNVKRNLNTYADGDGLPDLSSLPCFLSYYWSTSDPTSGIPYKITINTVQVRDRNNNVLDKILVSNDPIFIPLGQNKKSFECIDPRFNWNMKDDKQWSSASTNVSLRMTNNATIAYWSMYSDCDKDSRMYVYADLGDHAIKSVGELGCLAYDTWKTIKLYGTNDMRRVMDYFAVDTNSADFVTNAVWRGRINPNTREAAAMGAVFTDMPMDEYPLQTDPVPAKLSAAEVSAIVVNIQSNVYTNLSDIGLNFTAFPASAANDELKREAVFRNTCGLLNLRQNLFTIIIEAHVASGGNIPRNPVRQRAAAIVWRDPYTGEMFVRSIKWLKD